MNLGGTHSATKVVIVVDIILFDFSYEKIKFTRSLGEQGAYLWGLLYIGYVSGSGAVPEYGRHSVKYSEGGGMDEWMDD